MENNNNNKNIMIEMVIRKTSGLEGKLDSDIMRYLVVDLPEKIIFDVPLDWLGFKDGTLNSLLDTFGESLYIAIAYNCVSNNEVVTDFDGNKFEGYESLGNGRRVVKYVKKRIRIVNIIDRDENVFEVFSYALDLRVRPPVVKVLEVYSGGKDSGTLLEDFCCKV